MGESPGGAASATKLFAEGSEVEVEGNEEGFTGSWYVATVIDPTPRSTSKNKKKNKERNKVLVRYRDLLDEDGTSPLTEQVDVDLVRPLPPYPPPDAGLAPSFELYDVVDAYFRDGWWTGVITSVRGDSRFVVTFKNPPDELDFGLKDLRFHQDWVDGIWVRPEKQRTSGLMFRSGKRVEVSFNKKECHGAWFPATILEDLDNNSFLVKYESLGNDDDPLLLEATVDLQYIRPFPPQFEDRNFDFLEKVDGFYNFGWWSGEITKELADKRYIVSFETLKKEMELNLSQLRPHMEWTDGQWTAASRDTLLPVDVDHQEHVGQACIASKSAHTALHFGASGGTKNNSEERTPASLNSGEYETEQSAPSSFRKKTKQKNTASDASHSRPSKKLKENAPETPSVFRYPLDGMSIQTRHKETYWDFSSPATGGAGTNCSTQSMNGDQSSVKPQSRTQGKKVEISQLKHGESIPTQRRGRPTKLKAASPDADKKQNGDAADEMVSKDCNKNGVELPATTEGGSKKTPNGQTWRKRISSSIMKTCPAKKDKLPNLKVLQASSNQLEKPSSKRGRKQTANLNTLSQDSQDSSREKMGEVFKADSTGKELTMAIALVPYNVSDDQPLSAWFDGVSANRTGQQCTEIRKRQRELAMQNAAAAYGNGDIVPDPNQSLPFVRTVPLWQTIESMEVFRAMPQKPHFRPLNSCKEGSREGLAIGWMVTFSNAVKKTSMLQFVEPRSSIEDNLETLVELEAQGFDVGKIRDRLTELLLIKDRQEVLQDQSKELEIQIMHHNHEKTYIDEEIAEIDKQLRELQGKRALAMSKKEMKHSEVSCLESSAATVHEGIKSIQFEFEELAAAPW